jgi:hypothetical protein
VLIEKDYRSEGNSDQGIPIITGKSTGKLRSRLSEGSAYTKEWL